VGVEPTDDGISRRPPVLKITRDVLIRYENSLLYLILQPFTKSLLCLVLILLAAI
jgi:hypothetical protein